MTCGYLVVMDLVFRVHIPRGALNPIWKKVPAHDKIVPTPSLLILKFLNKETFLGFLFSHHFYLHVIFPTSSTRRQLIFLHSAGNPC